MTVVIPECVTSMSMKPAAASKRQPGGELPQRVSVQVYGIHPPILAPPRPVSDIDLARYAAKQRSAALSTVTVGHVRDGIGTDLARCGHVGAGNRPRAGSSTGEGRADRVEGAQRVMQHRR